VGVEVGYVNSDLNFHSGDDFNYSGATVGVYGTLLKGPLYVDAQFKADLLTLKPTTGPLSGAGTVSSNSYGGQIEAGYRFPIHGTKLTVEPVGTLAYVETEIGTPPSLLGTVI